MKNTPAPANNQAKLKKRHGNYEDVRRTGQRLIVPREFDEKWKDRHERCHRRNSEDRKELENWAFEHGLRLRIKNRSHHWILRDSDVVVEGWRRTAKLVINYNYAEGNHTHDWMQLFNLINRLRLRRMKQAGVKQSAVQHRFLTGSRRG